MTDIKNGADITAALREKREKGGAVFLPVGEYTADSPILMDTPSLRVTGEVWAYNLDPNGVFESRYGTKIRLKGRDHAAFSIGSADIPAGSMISDIGIQGDIIGMDTRGMFDMARPYASAGLYFGGRRVDQGDFSKISCCGLAAGVSMAESAEVDACDFRKINVDGCCVGFYLSPRAVFYTHVNRCIIADNPSYGLFVDGMGKHIRNVDITDTHFVRNCGANHISGEPNAAVYLKNVKACVFRDNLVDDPGTFWYYEPDAVSNRDKTVFKNPAVGLYLIGDGNRIFNNIFSNSKAESMMIEGDGNVLIGNIVDGNVVIEGRGNTVNGLVFTTPEARLILSGAAADSTVVLGVEESRIVRRS